MIPENSVRVNGNGGVKVLIRKSSGFREDPRLENFVHAIDRISRSYLKFVVDSVSIPRHYIAEHGNNVRIAQWIEDQFSSLGYDVFLQGDIGNVIAMPKLCSFSSCILVATHYDTVPQSPGADDNGSGIASALACAKALPGQGRDMPVIFAIFNREEDGLLGSRRFVEHHVAHNRFEIKEAHILEMVGYCSHEKGSQHIPRGLPVRVPDVGNFLGIIANRTSNHLVDGMLKRAKTYVEGFPVIGLKVYLGMEDYFPHLKRSDHAPFWKAGIPALMWTDTSEFRNPNYHAVTDTPDTLDYDFMRKVAQLLLIQILQFESNENTE